MNRPVIIGAALLLTCTGLAAQTMNSGFFLEHYSYAYRLNPSLTPENGVSGFFALGTGNFSDNLMTNSGVSSYYFPIDGKLLNGFNRQISSEQFPGGLEDISVLDNELNVNILTAGLQVGGNGFATVELNFRSSMDVSLPKSLFVFLKDGPVEDGGSQVYDIDAVSVHTGNIAELALGYSHRIGDRLKLGARVKYEAGIAYGGMEIDNMSFTIPGSYPGEIAVRGKGRFRLAAPVKIGCKPDGTVDFESFEAGKAGIAGSGLVFDFGVTYKPVENLLLSLSVEDLGSIKWEGNFSSEMSESRIPVDDASEITDADRMFVFRQTAGAEGFTGTFDPCFRAGAKYTMPFCNGLTAGLLGTFRTGNHRYSDVRIGAGFTPFRQLSLTADIGFTSAGTVCGAALNLSLGIVNLFLGADSVAFEMTPQFLPVNPVQETITAGLILQFRNS